MSISSLQNSVQRLQRELADVQKQISDETKKEVEKTRKLNDISRSLSGSTNLSLSAFNSKLQEQARVTNELAQVQTKKAELGRKLADKTKQLHSYELDLAREQERERKKQNDAEKQRQQKQLDHQRRITAELAEQRRIAQSMEQTATPVISRDVTYDVFISHASEDKDEFVRPLAKELEAHGFEVWYDEFTLKVGDSLRRSIDQGLANSRFGIVVLSSSFFAKRWTDYELNGLINREMNGVKVVLPIWHKVTKNEVQAYSPSIADKVALNSSLQSIKEIVAELSPVIRGED